MTTHRVLLVASALGAGLLLSGCADDPPPAVPTPGTATVAASADATVAQWASLISPHEREWRDQVATVEDNCRRLEGLVACNLGYVTLSLQAQTVAVVLTGATGNPDASTYLGEPPPEIADLVDRTVAVAEAVTPAVDAWTESGCQDPLAPECLADSLVLEQAVNGLTSTFDAWRPYL